MATKATDAIPTDTLGKRALFIAKRTLKIPWFLCRGLKKGFRYVIVKVYVRNRIAFPAAPAQTPTCLGCA